MSLPNRYASISWPPVLLSIVKRFHRIFVYHNIQAIERKGKQHEVRPTFSLQSRLFVPFFHAAFQVWVVCEENLPAVWPSNLISSTNRIILKSTALPPHPWITIISFDPLPSDSQFVTIKHLFPLQQKTKWARTARLAGYGGTSIVPSTDFLDGNQFHVIIPSHLSRANVIHPIKVLCLRHSVRDGSKHWISFSSRAVD